MTIVSVHRAEELADLIRRAKAGEEIVIAADETLRARLVPVEPAAREPGKGLRRPGRMKSQLNLPDEFFFEPLPEDELRLWEGEGHGPQ